MANKSIQASIEKLTASNYHTWSREVQSFLSLEEVWDVVDPDDTAPTTAAAHKRDAKAYAHIWFLVAPEFRDPLTDLSAISGRAAWAALKTEHEKDNPSTRMALRQQFYSLRHNTATSVTAFISAVLSITRQLEAIKHKPAKDEITDKLLIGLDPSFSAIRTTLSLRKPEPTLGEITAALKEFELNEPNLKSAAANPFSPVETFYVNGKKFINHTSRSGGGGGALCNECDWGNTKKREGVCWRCGRPGHVAQYCVADMPDDVKRRILDRSNKPERVYLTADDIANGRATEEVLLSMVDPNIGTSPDDLDPDIEAMLANPPGQPDPPWLKDVAEQWEREREAEEY